MPEINYTVVIQVVNFLLLLFLLNVIVYKPVRNLLSKRREEMDTTALLTEEWKRKIENSSIAIEERIAAAKKEGVKERLSIRDSGLSHEKELVQDAFIKVEKEIESAMDEIRDKIGRARISLYDEIESLSLELAEKILGRPVG
ncbi:MAG: ATP synthase F0 subunit B [Deltaproteobacteria bacterium]|nr:ATP synthase F0 subunit B [Deltaproteobacteria bacterium]